MSGLHTRGYRPEHGERVAHVGTRAWWGVCYQFVRTDDRDESNFDRLARRCLAARSLPDWLSLSPEARAMIRAYRRRVRRRVATEGGS